VTSAAALGGRGCISFDAALVAALFAIDPAGLCGVALRASAGFERDAWLGLLRRLLPDQTPFRRVPLNINDTALLGGLDLGATLNAGRPVAQQGVLAQADRGIVVLAMAERLPLGTAARLAAVLDSGEVAIERDGLTVRNPARLGLVALDEGMADDERVPAALLDRMAFHVVLDGRADAAVDADSETKPLQGAATVARTALNAELQDGADWQLSDIVKARALLPRVTVSDETVQALCAAALALGVGSLRAPLLALRVARAAAALAGAAQVEDEHGALAARLVLAPRATLMPASASADDKSSDGDGDERDKAPDADADDQDPPPPQADAPEQPDDPTPDTVDADTEEPDPEAGNSLAEMVLAAAQAAIPAGLLAALKIGQAARARAQAAGRSGAAQKSQTRGRPLGARRGEPRAGSRLNVIETLRAAAPWQRLRQQEAVERAACLLHTPQPETGGPTRPRIHVRREDFHVTRFKQVGQTTTLFVVDASGSSALNRLAEAKGAVELLLADCYVRRDRVAVLAFRGKTAELLLPPTRSLARAKRSLAGLPGGGGTPLATAIDAARELADQISRRGETPIVVLLTDGRGNIARDGSPGRVRASDDALAAARQVRVAGITCLLMDTSPKPQPTARLLAQEMGAAYVPLPYAGAKALSQVVAQVSQVARAATASGAR
jgi:magnesium chelatase subunit D